MAKLKYLLEPQEFSNEYGKHHHKTWNFEWYEDWFQKLKKWIIEIVCLYKIYNKQYI